MSLSIYLEINNECNAPVKLGTKLMKSFASFTEMIMNREIGIMKLLFQILFCNSHIPV